MSDIWLFLYYPFMEAKRKLFTARYLAVVILIGFICILNTVTLRRFSYLTGYSITALVFFLFSIF